MKRRGRKKLAQTDIRRDGRYRVYWRTGQAATYSGFEILTAKKFFREFSKVVLDANNGREVSL